MPKHSPLYHPTAVLAPLDEARSEVLYGDERAMFAHVGFFLYGFTSAEFFLTMLLWCFTGAQTPNAFHILTRGMDAKAKVVRLREAITLHGSTLGTNLKRRLAHFEESQANVRNKLTHNFLTWNAEVDELEIGHMGALPRMGEMEFGPKRPESMPGGALFERGCWLNLFSQDLMDLITSLPPPPRAIPQGTIEIANPRCGVPMGGPLDRPRIDPHANARKRAEKRARRSPG